MFSLLPFAAFVKRFSAKNETDARKRGFHPPARRVFPQKSSDNTLSDLSRLFFQALDTGKSDLSLSSAKNESRKRPSGVSFDALPAPRLFRREAPTPAKPFPFSAKARRGTGTRARRAPPLPCARSAAAKSPRSSPDSISPDAPFPNSPRIYRISSFCSSSRAFRSAFEAVFPSAFPFALFYDDSIAYIN